VKERQEIYETLLSAGFFPAGMEYFSQWNDDTWALIEKIIDSCDYYLLIIGGRYGSLYNNEISYTEKEYNHALEIKIPCVVFLSDNPSIFQADKELRGDDMEKLANFRNSIQPSETTILRHWKGATDLVRGVALTMKDLPLKKPAPGWVRGDYTERVEQSLGQRIHELEERIHELEARGFPDVIDGGDASGN
jgi:hypothetical protein